jgi:hypothetical protein
MRVLFAFALLTLGIAAMTPARAADLVDSDGGSYGGDWSHGVRAAPVALYDYEPGVIVRQYWLSPWRHRHYFPTTGQRPALGRLEDLSATGAAPQPAETFFRAWSTTDLIPRRAPRIRIHARGLDDEGVPQRDGRIPNAPVKP